MTRYRMVKGVRVRCCGRKPLNFEDDIWWEYVKPWKEQEQKEELVTTAALIETDTCGIEDDRVVYICPDCIQRAGFIW